MAWLFFVDNPDVNNDGVIVDFNAANVADSFRFKEKIRGQTKNISTINVETMVPAKYLSNFWRSLEMSLLIAKLKKQKRTAIIKKYKSIIKKKNIIK